MSLSIDTSNLKAVLFDLGGTLIEYVNNPPLEIFEDFKKRLTHNDPPITCIDFCVMIERYWVTMQDEFYSSGTHQTIADFNQAFLINQGFSYETSFKLATPFDEIIFQLELTGTVAIDGAIALLNHLKEKKYKLGVVTNASHTESRIRQLMRHVEIEHFFATVVISSVVGIQKPDPEIFQIALNELSINASQALYIGDRLDYDAQGAENAGIQFVIISDKIKLKSIMSEIIAVQNKPIYKKNSH